MLELDARAWPVGAARIRVTLQPIDADRTEGRMSERLTSPKARYIPRMVQDLALVPRTRECLTRLDVHHIRGRHLSEPSEGTRADG